MRYVLAVIAWWALFSLGLIVFLERDVHHADRGSTGVLTATTVAGLLGALGAAIILF